MEYNPVILKLEDNDVVLHLAQAIGEHGHVTATLYKDGKMIDQKKARSIMEMVKILKKFEVMRWT
jgi:hypothetical protein